MAADLLLQAVARICEVLAAHRLPAALMGGIAVSAWKGLRATRDVDLLVGAPEAEGLLAVLPSTFRPRRDPPVVRIGEIVLVQLLYEPPGAYLPVQVDLVMAASAYQRQALERRVALLLPGVDDPLAVLSCEDLILFKLLAGRIIDRADVAALLRDNVGTLDFDYLAGTASELGVSDELDSLRRTGESRLGDLRC